MNQKGYFDFRLPEPLVVPPVHHAFGDIVFAAFLGVMTATAIAVSRMNACCPLVIVSQIYNNLFCSCPGGATVRSHI